MESKKIGKVTGGYWLRKKGSIDSEDLEPRQVFYFETEGIYGLGEDIKREEE